jgi:hypothetical protein
MAEKAAVRTPKKGVRSRLKLDKLEIPLFDRRKKNAEGDKSAAEFLSNQRGKSVAVVNCSPDSGVAVVLAKDKAVLEVEILGASGGSEGGDKESPKS